MAAAEELFDRRQFIGYSVDYPLRRRKGHSMADHTELDRTRMREFNAWIAALPRTTKVIGSYADGTEVAVTVPSLFS